MVVAVLAATCISAHASSVKQSPSPAAEAARFVRADAPITLDGRLHEPSWFAAPPVTRFFEIYPANVGSPPTDTQVRFLYDNRHVYVGVRALDPDPKAIRAPLVKRDDSTTNHDYVEIYIDTMNARRSALLFRSNARGVVSDAQFNEETQVRSFAPDLDFDVRTSQDARGWSAEFRIPLSTLRYEVSDRPWTFLVVRGYPRATSIRIASAPIPRSANCLLCFAATITGFAPPVASIPVSVTPYIAFSLSEEASTGLRLRESALRGGVDAKWQPRPDDVVDFTVRPDFSQVEADAVQLTANTRFALFVAEKRPFFLEGVDLLSTPVAALHTRSITEPDTGVRFTRRREGRDLTALVVRDTGGGSVIEPGPLGSQIGLQDFESTALLGRLRRSTRTVTTGLLVSGRLNDDGSDNLLFGADASWSPSPSDRLIGQVLWSRTENPDRPDLLPAWNGQRLAGAAATLRWEHRVDAWFADVSHERYSHEFRAWNGFVPQVGVATSSASLGLNFYPRDSFFLKVSPYAQFARTDEAGGAHTDGSTSLGLQIDAGRTTLLTLARMAKLEPTPAGLQSLDSWSLTAAMSPTARWPLLSLSVSDGDGLDVVTGERAEQLTSSALARLRLLDRCDVSSTFASQQLDNSAGQRILANTVAQATATWHFSTRAYLQVLHQQSHTMRRADDGTTPSEDRTTAELSTVLLSVQPNSRTRFFVGYSHSVVGLEGVRSSRTSHGEAFAKFTYAFAFNGADRSTHDDGLDATREGFMNPISDALSMAGARGIPQDVFIWPGVGRRAEGSGSCDSVERCH